MKFGLRKPSFKKSISARTTGKVKRKLKRLANPFYGKKGMGWIRNPKKALYNKIYNKTSISTRKAGNAFSGCLLIPFLLIFEICKVVFILMFYMTKYSFLALYWAMVALINGIISFVEILMNIGADDDGDDLITSLPETLDGKADSL